MNLVLYKHHSFIHCFVLSLKDQTYTTDSRKPFLEIDVKGGERDHIKAQGGERDHIKACRRERSHQGREKVSRTKPTREKVLRRERDFQWERILKDPRCPRCLMLDVQEERCHMYFLGERHVFALSSIHLYLSALIFCSPSSPNIPCKIQGEQDT